MEIIDKTIDLSKDVDSRIVVRGIVLIENKILVVYPKNSKVYGTPGGGVDEGESFEQALRRELNEEVGATNVVVKEYIGNVNVYRKGKYSSVFNPIHHYYLVDILEFGDKNLVDYELELELECDFLDIDYVINENMKSIIKAEEQCLDFYRNQIVILKIIKELYMR
ncbi:NUDIX domain-containing protein [Mycoplasmatota bacterium]|nr:NUDIX domain-containing protein [Mycoplasmatota bacterium]